MVNISKEEAKILVQLGVKYGENGISHSVTKSKNRNYLCESKHNMELLKKIREGRITN